MDFLFWKNKRVFLTGHTGFKGAWLCRILLNAGARLTGYALNPPTEPSLFALSKMETRMTSIIGDIRDASSLYYAFSAARPEIVFHLAAQPLVLAGYSEPVYTYETNVMGTVNILECVRKSGTVKSFLNITTDKVYQNNEWEWGYREIDQLGGFDPYSNSKSCSELVTHAYKNSFFADGSSSISTARAGNVIGGGDFAANRIIPDCVRAAARNEQAVVRNPHAVRPYQHVLEPLFAYLMIAEKQYGDPGFAGYYNIGPEECDCVSTGKLADLFFKHWEGLGWINRTMDGPHEAGLLKLDCSRIKTKFGWKPLWRVSEAVLKTVQWSKAYLYGGDINAIMDDTILEYARNGADDV